MTRLSRASLAGLPPAILRPAYDPDRVTTGIVHLGAGAFHRAHQAAYFDALLAADPRWGIAAVSLRSATVTEALAAQDGLFTLAIADRVPSLQVIAAHREAIGPGQLARLTTRLADPTVRLVTITVTEKGYCLAADGTLDWAAPAIAHDRDRPRLPASVVGWLATGLAARRALGIAPFAVLCCDNIAGNGARLRAATLALAAAWDGDLARWIADRVPFPATMVDAITPASDAAFLSDIATVLGVEDRAAVRREAFSQWVVEQFDLADGPDLASVGVTLTANVAGYEQAKLRILNAAHSALAYLGLLRGHVTVAEAMADAELAGFIAALVTTDIIPTLPAPPGLDLHGYAEAVFARFRNPVAGHRLSQIAADGSQKLPHRLFPTIEAAVAAGRPLDRLARPIAAWIAFLRRAAARGEAVADPLAPALLTAVTAPDPVAALLSLPIVPPVLAAHAPLRAAITAALPAR